MCDRKAHLGRAQEPTPQERLSFALVAITERGLCPEPLPQRIARLIRAGFDAVILREKDLGPDAYRELASQAVRELERAGLDPRRLVVHGLHGLPLGTLCRHVPLNVLRAHAGLRPYGGQLGASVHSAAEAVEAQQLGADYLVAGHVFATACKPGMEPRGLPWLREVCRLATLPVLAVGGIAPANAAAVREAGAAGACIRGAAMEGEATELEALVRGFRAAAETGSR